MTLGPPNINSLWGTLIIEELMRNGVDYFCISPGSRSTPLAVAVARNSYARSIICYDERGAAFHALGFARGSGMPAAVISTSGTAAANYYPAVVEASVDCIPLVVLTADRPPELRDTGANQTIDQVNLYGKYVRWHADVPCPDEVISPRFILTTVDHAFATAMLPPRGPVHINCMFREPLAPEPSPVSDTYIASLKKWGNTFQPQTVHARPAAIPDSRTVQDLVKTLQGSKRGVIAVGRLPAPSDRQAVARLSQKIDWPVFADIASGLRTVDSPPQVIHYCDQLLLSPSIFDTPPDTVLHIGGQLTSKRFLQFIEKNPPVNYIIVKEHPFRHDPLHTVTQSIQSHITPLCNALEAGIKIRRKNEWLGQLTAHSQTVDSIVDAHLSRLEKISEPAALRIVSQNIPGGSGLFLASSMPIRDMDMYGAPCAGDIEIGANRGASGVDGTIAAGAGFAVGRESTVTLVIGDIAFLHDMNSLSLLNNIAHKLVIVVINNRGGGIFSFLPIADYEDVFEKYFGTPHNFSFKNAAAQFSLPYYNPVTAETFRRDYLSALAGGSSAVIEIQTNRHENAELHRALQREIVAALEK